MAAQLQVRSIALQAPFTGSYSCAVYNGLVYIHTTSAIYTYDPVNNSYETKLEKSSATGSRCVLHQGKLYSFRDVIYTGNSAESSLRMDVYDIETNTQQIGVVSFSLGNYLRSQSFSAPYMVGDLLCIQANYYKGQYSYSSYAHVFIYDTTSGATSTVTASGMKDSSSPAAGQYTDNYMFGTVQAQDSSYYGHFGLLTDTGYTYQGTWDTVTRGYASFRQGNQIYILGGLNRETAVSVYDVDSNKLTDLALTLPFACYNRFCAAVEDRYYLFGTDAIAELYFQDDADDSRPVYIRRNGAWQKRTAYERVDGAWVKISTG